MSKRKLAVTVEDDISDQNAKGDSVSDKKSTTQKRTHIRDVVQPAAIPVDQNMLRLMSWNVNGLRALVSNKLDILQRLVEQNQPDVLCLQETKLQETHVTPDYRNLLPGYVSYWSCSTEKKGYSGTAIFLKTSTIRVSECPVVEHCSSENQKNTTKKKPQQLSLSKMWGSKAKSSDADVAKAAGRDGTSTAAVQVQDADCSSRVAVQNVSFDFEDDQRCFEGEGRTITVEFDKFYLVACYVPNSGDNLKRLEYRVNDWEPHMRQYLNKLSSRKPVVFTGDLNCGHLDLDIHNPQAKHIAKQAGLTPQERAAFAEMLRETGFRDAFRFFYPDARGQFTYWSQRTFARPVNNGIRLDYFLCSPQMFPTATATTAAAATGTVQQHTEPLYDAATAGGPAATAVMEEDVRVAQRIMDAAASVAGIPVPGVFDSFVIHDQTVGCSDHCPVMLVVKV